jgi:peptidylprolyl isomerase
MMMTMQSADLAGTRLPGRLCRSARPWGRHVAVVPRSSSSSSSLSSSSSSLSSLSSSLPGSNTEAYDTSRDISAQTSRSDLLRSIVLSSMALAVPLALDSTSARAEIGQFVEPVEVPKLLCDASCLEALSTVERVKLPSGLEFQDIKVGTGPAAPVGYQVVLHYILMTADGRVISNSLENGTPYDIRVGTGQVVAGLDEGLKTMRVGGIRRVYVPEGELSFPKGLPSAPGRPRVAPGAPVIFDVQLLYVPGLDDEE